MSPVIRPLTSEDWTAFYGHAPEQSVRGFVAILDGEPIALAALVYQGPGRSIGLMSDMKPAMCRYPKAIVKGARAILEMAKGVPAHALADPRFPNSAKLLTRLGFEQSEEVFLWPG